MAELSFRLTTKNLDGRIRAILMKPDGVVDEDVKRRARAVSALARTLARERSEDSSGALPNSIRYFTFRGSGFSVVAQVGSDLPHAIWAEEGTGIYGPHRTPIVPRRARFMVFESRRLGGVVFATSVKGQRGKHFLRDALQAARE